jgi:hypothetical protein
MQRHLNILYRLCIILLFIKKQLNTFVVQYTSLFDMILSPVTYCPLYTYKLFLIFGHFFLSFFLNYIRENTK